MQYLKINRRSDFSCVIEFKTGETVVSPDNDFTLLFSTGKEKYLVARRGSELVNCSVSGGVLTASFIGHGLGKGVMICRQSIEYANPSFPGGKQHLEATFNTSIKLIDGVGDDISPTTKALLPSADYDNLANKPAINGVTLKGDKNNSDLKLNLTFVSI